MDDTLQKLVTYVNAAADLAEALESDIKRDQKVSSKTVVALSRFVSAAHTFKAVTERLGALN